MSEMAKAIEGLRQAMEKAMERLNDVEKQLYKPLGIKAEEDCRPTCDECGNSGPLKYGWPYAPYCSEKCERAAVSRLHRSMPGAGPLPYAGWVPAEISNEISRRWGKDKA